MEYFEADSRQPAPTCVLLRLNREPCASWSQAHNDRKPSLLATSLVARLEIFCLRLSATASLTVARPRLLVAGWLPEVDTAPFVKRGFSFNQEPYATGKHAGKQGGLGFKLLKTDADRAKALAKPPPATDSPSAPPPTSALQVGVRVRVSVRIRVGVRIRARIRVSLTTSALQGKRKRAVAEESASAAAPASTKLAPWPVRKPSASGSEQPGGDASQGAPSAGVEGANQRTQEEPGSAVTGPDEVGEAPP